MIRNRNEIADKNQKEEEESERKMSNFHDQLVSTIAIFAVHFCYFVEKIRAKDQLKIFIFSFTLYLITSKN